MKRAAALVVAALLVAGGVFVSGAPQDKMIGVNVVLKTAITKAALAELGRFGRVRDQIPELNAVTLQARASELASIQALSIVASASPDAERKGRAGGYGRGHRLHGRAEHLGHGRDQRHGLRLRQPSGRV